VRFLGHVGDPAEPATLQAGVDVAIAAGPEALPSARSRVRPTAAAQVHDAFGVRSGVAVFPFVDGRPGRATTPARSRGRCVPCTRSPRPPGRQALAGVRS